MAVEPGKIVAVTPKTHFEQEDLAELAACARSEHRDWALKAGGYDDELERRLRQLDWTVQGELYSLLHDRSESTSNSFRHREYKLVMLLEVPGGDMTKAAFGRQGRKKRWWEVFQKKRPARTSHVEYRVILRGCETAATNAGWGVYQRYSQPWKLADEAGLASVREKMGYQELLG